MKALVKKERARGLWLEDVPEPEPGINDVKIAVKRTAICGTDLHIYKWDEWAQKTIPVPMVVGHEFVGEIVEVGDNVNDYAPGMIVSGEGHIVCGRCRNCMAGRRHLCPYTSGVGVNRPGAFAEYIVIPNANVWHHADGIDLDVASIFDPFGNATHTALQWDLVGEDVLITGAGPIGAMAAAVARHAGARHVVITDVNDYRLVARQAARRHPHGQRRPGEAGRRPEGARHDRGLRRRPRNVGQSAARSATCSTTWRMAARSRCSASPRARSRSTGTRSSSTC